MGQDQKTGSSSFLKADGLGLWGGGVQHKGEALAWDKERGTVWRRPTQRVRHSSEEAGGPRLTEDSLPHPGAFLHRPEPGPALGFFENPLAPVLLPQSRYCAFGSRTTQYPPDTVQTPRWAKPMGKAVLKGPGPSGPRSSLPIVPPSQPTQTLARLQTWGHQQVAIQEADAGTMQFRGPAPLEPVSAPACAGRLDTMRIDFLEAQR